MKLGQLFIEEKVRDDKGSKKSNYDLCCFFHHSKDSG